MGTEIELIEKRSKSLLKQFQLESSVFERVMYKSKNQHRRCSYFHHLLRVRRDLRLLESAKLQTILDSCFQVINGKNPKHKLNLLESLKGKSTNCGKYNFLERLLGAARLLSQIVEPILKAATDISVLLARSFFMGIFVTVLALLARLRVLVQQMLLDAVSVYNVVSSISQKKQSIQITHQGIQIYGEYFPALDERAAAAATTLECVWETDKFVLHEHQQRSEAKSQTNDAEHASASSSSAKLPPRYSTLESFLGDDSDSDFSDEDEPLEEFSFRMDLKGRKNPPPTLPSPSPSFSSKPAVGTGQVAFLSVKRPASAAPSPLSSKKPAFLSID